MDVNVQTFFTFFYIFCSFRLSRRLSTSNKSSAHIYASSPADESKGKEILSSPEAPKYMPSEESDQDMDMTAKGPRPRKVKKLAWERSELRNIKVRLDEEYFKGLSGRQRRTSSRIIRTDQRSTCPCPLNGPRWAVRDSTN